MRSSGGLFARGSSGLFMGGSGGGGGGGGDMGLSGDVGRCGGVRELRVTFIVAGRIQNG